MDARHKTFQILLVLTPKMWQKAKHRWPLQLRKIYIITTVSVGFIVDMLHLCSPTYPVQPFGGLFITFIKVMHLVIDEHLAENCHTEIVII